MATFVARRFTKKCARTTVKTTCIFPPPIIVLSGPPVLQSNWRPTMLAACDLHSTPPSLTSRVCAVSAFGVRITPFVLAVCTIGGIAACSDAPSKSLTAPGAMDRAVSSATVANATIHEIPALLNVGVDGLNDSDEVSGDSGGRPFKWSAAHGFQWLSTTGLIGAHTTGISNNGAVAGSAVAGDSGFSHGIVWLPNGTPRVLALPTDSDNMGPEVGKITCAIAAINIYGQSVGNCVVKDGFSSPVGFQWHGPALSPPPGVPGNDQLTSISDDGWIGGGNLPAVFGTTGAFIVSPTGQTILLKNHNGQLAGGMSWVQA